MAMILDAAAVKQGRFADASCLCEVEFSTDEITKMW